MIRGGNSVAGEGFAANGMVVGASVGLDGARSTTCLSPLLRLVRPSHPSSHLRLVRPGVDRQSMYRYGYGGYPYN